MTGDPGTRKAITLEDQLYEDALPYFFFLERWHMHPNDVDECPQWLVDRLPGVAAIVDEIREDEQRVARQQ